MAGIDRDLLRGLDRHLRGTGDGVALATPVSPPAPSARFDISAVLEAVQHTAVSMTTMAERIQELEAHSQAFEVSNRELGEQGAQLAAELSEVAQQRDVLAADLEAEKERYRELETRVAGHVSRSTALDRDLGVARTDLAKIVEAVGSALGRPA